MVENMSFRPSGACSPSSTSRQDLHCLSDMKPNTEIDFFAKHDTDHAREELPRAEESLRLAKMELDIERAMANEANVALAAESAKTEKKIAATKKEQEAIEKAQKLQEDTDKMIERARGANRHAMAKDHREIIEQREKEKEAFTKTALAAVKADDLQRTSFRNATEAMVGDSKLRTQVGSELLDQAKEWETQLRSNALREEELHRLVVEGTVAQQQYALAQLEIINAQKETSKGMEKQKTELEVLTEGYEQFFNNL
jgi:hypothetical protein